MGSSSPGARRLRCYRLGQATNGEIERRLATAGAAAGTGEGTPAKGIEKTGEDSKLEALEHVLETVEALFRERDGNVWGSMVKQTLKRKRPMFNETYHGYDSFSTLLEDADKRGLLKLQKDPKSGGYIIMGFGPEA